MVILQKVEESQNRNGYPSPTKRSKDNDTTMVILYQSCNEAVAITSNESKTIRGHTTCSKKKEKRKKNEKRKKKSDERKEYRNKKKNDDEIKQEQSRVIMNQKNKR